MIFTRSDREQLKALQQARESSVDKEITAYLSGAIGRGAVAWFCPVALSGKKVGKCSTAKNEMAGFPDIMGRLASGEFFFVEVKRPSKKGALSPKQIEWAGRLMGEHSLHVVAKSVEDVRRMLEPEAPDAAAI